ncbi:hypothetical protein JT359_18110 [Candidatus Poribacteria bacterium]|nr:hypothetical protein [Candidatus Poribacteria bacterium]
MKYNIAPAGRKVCRNTIQTKWSSPGERHKAFIPLIRGAKGVLHKICPNYC